ncbi:MAG TPA: phosphoglyceromutase [Acidimicrobiia bacterium]|jgi:2,3-bisphosphoglycerate-dependent phosphoglycerate mutase|nr:phosphoglyceromutase [Acidimicrobiia bacterium]HIL45815.1 phosphoglyceromutase [Acidimicrobiia bacterium]
MALTLILLRHGQSEWNATNQFTGWYDSGLTEQGVNEALAGADLLEQANILPDIVHTSLQTRAIRTAELTLGALNRSWIPVKRSWRLNERHYGDLTGLNKTETGEKFGQEQLQAWRRGYHTPPPPIADDNPYNPNGDPRYAHLDQVPLTECLADVVDRMVPYWESDILPDLQNGRTVLVAAHGNSLRSLCKYLDHISDQDIAELNIPTGTPLIYQLDPQGKPLEAKPVLQRSLDPAAAQAAAQAVARQAG